MKMAPVLMKMAPGAIPRPGRVPERRLLSPETEFRMAAEHGGVFPILTISSRVYASGAIYGPKEGSGSVIERPRHRRAWSPPRPRPAMARGLWAPQHLPFWLRESSGEISSTQFVSSNSENFGFLAFLQ